MGPEEQDSTNAFGTWRPAETTRRWVGFILLALTTGTLLTNAYYLSFAEPALPRKTLASAVFLATGLWFLLCHVGLPKNMAEGKALFHRAKTPLLVGAIVVAGFAVRYDGIRSGLPQSYIPDEYEYVHSYLQMIKRGDMNPRWWHHPSVQPYVNVATYLTVFYLEARNGRWETIHQMQVEDMLFWGRLGAGVIPGTLAILLVFYLGRRVFDTRVGLIGATIFALAPGVVEASQYNKPDSLLVMFSSLTVLVTMLYLDRGGGRLAFAAGAVVGVTVAVKYNAALLLIPLFAAVLFRRGLAVVSSSDIYLGVLGSIVGFAAGCPYFYADLPRFLDHVGAGLYNYGFRGIAGAEGVDNWYNHAMYTIRYGAGWWAFLACLAGLAVALFRIDRRLTVFLAYPVLYYSFYSSQRINFPGNLMPVYPFLAILAAFGVVAIVGLISRFLDQHLQQPLTRRLLNGAATAMCLTIVLWFPTSMTLMRNHLITLPDTGAIAAVWINANFPPGTHLAMERHTPVLDRERFVIEEDKHVTNKGIGHLRDAGVQYIVAASTNYQRFGPAHRQTRRYQRMFELCPLIKEFAPEQGRTMGPTIRILQVPPEEQ